MILSGLFQCSILRLIQQMMAAFLLSKGFFFCAGSLGLTTEFSSALVDN